MALEIKIQIKRVAGVKTKGPHYQVILDDKVIHEEPIAGLADVQPGFLRATAVAKKNGASREFVHDGQKMVWIEEPAAEVMKSEEKTEMTTKPMPKADAIAKLFNSQNQKSAGKEPAFLNRGLPHKP
jgi:hypothetical protein